MKKNHTRSGDFDFFIGQLIRKQRENLEFSREALAELTGMSANYLGEVERGAKGISAFFLYKLSVSLGVTMDYFVVDRQTNDELDMIISILRSNNDKIDIKTVERVIRALILNE